jgi:hypothetical protein
MHTSPTQYHVIHRNCRRAVAFLFALVLASLSAPSGAAGFPAKPAGINDDAWSALQRSVVQTMTQQAKLSGDVSVPGADGLTFDYFGYAVAVSGDTAIVGAPRDSFGVYFNNGSVYVYLRSGSSWDLQTKLTPDADAQLSQFGAAVALSGDVALIGAYDDDEGRGAAYVFTRSGVNWSQQAKLVASDAAFDDEFGNAVALSGDTALIGAHGDDVSRGSAYVFVRNGVSWSEQAKLISSDGAANDLFGTSVALSGDTALVGAYGQDADTTDEGSAYIFTRLGTNWTQRARLNAGDGSTNDLFGRTVALVGDTALIGACNFQNIGAAYVFVGSGASWSEQAKLTASDGAPGDCFGTSIALANDVALVGAPYANGFMGASYVYTRSAVTWSERARLTSADAGLARKFGSAVALSGDTVFVGATEGDYALGSAYAFTGSGASWNEQDKVAAGKGAAFEQFGYAVALEGDTAVVGVPGDEFFAGSAQVFTRTGDTWTPQARLQVSDNVQTGRVGISVALSGDTALLGTFNFQGQGAAYVFVRNAAIWTQQAKLTASDGTVDNAFGRTLALSGNTALVGAFNDSAARGAAYVFLRNGNTWSQQAKLVADDGMAGDAFGNHVALAGDTALIGAWLDDGGFVDQGTAYVFQRSGTIWSQQSRLTADDAALGDSFGNAVALFGDTVLVGARKNDVDHVDQGAAYVYQRTGTIWNQQARLLASDAATATLFGSAVALQGDTALVGASVADGDFIGQGAAYVFTRATGTWTQHAKLTATDGQSADSFGSSVALLGTTALIGASADSGVAPFGDPLEGSVYVFTDVPVAPFTIFADGFE